MPNFITNIISDLSGVAYRVAEEEQEQLNGEITAYRSNLEQQLALQGQNQIGQTQTYQGSMPLTVINVQPSVLRASLGDEFYDFYYPNKKFKKVTKLPNWF